MKKLIFIFGIIILMPLMGKADIIFFKDGMKTVCRDKAWEEGKEVKCEYEGTILSYQKKDVLRIEKRKIEKKIEPLTDQTKPSPKAAASTAPRSSKIKSPVKIKPPAPQQKPLGGNESKAVSKNDTGASHTTGLEFYNPRRPQKYWISATAKYRVFEAAIAALAQQYDRSPEWIKQHMGETNDLDEIHRNLASSKLNTPAEIRTDTAIQVSETLFYNPRRPYKYWTSKTAKHKTFMQAISALAEEYERSQQWIQQYMGDTNNLNEIHQNLNNSKSAETSQ